MKNVSVEKRYMNIKEFFSSIGRELAELIGPQIVGETQTESGVELAASKVKQQESGYRRDLESMFDYSRQTKSKQKEDKELGKGKVKGKGKGKTEQYKAEVQNPTRQTSRQAGRKSQGKTSEGYEQEL